MSERKHKISKKETKLHKFAYAEGDNAGKPYKVRNIYTTTLSQSKQLKKDKKNKKEHKSFDL